MIFISFFSSLQVAAANEVLPDNAGVVAMVSRYSLNAGEAMHAR